MDEAERRPPWTVKALIALSVVGALIGLIQQPTLGYAIPSLGFCAVFSWAYWNGQRWAFSLTFAFTLLAAIFLIWATIVAGEVSLAQTAYPLATLIAYLILLRHPLTKHYLGLAAKERETV